MSIGSAWERMADFDLSPEQRLEFGEGTSELHRKLIAEFALGIRKQ